MTTRHCHFGEQAAAKKRYLALKLIVDIFKIFQNHQVVHRRGEKNQRRERETVCKCRQILLQTSLGGYLVSLVKYSLSNLTLKSLFAP